MPLLAHLNFIYSESDNIPIKLLYNRRCNAYFLPE